MNKCSDINDSERFNSERHALLLIPVDIYVVQVVSLCIVDLLPHPLSDLADPVSFIVFYWQ